MLRRPRDGDGLPARPATPCDSRGEFRPRLRGHHGDKPYSDILSLHMRLESGSRLGPYEISGPIGAGGMGEVYRARDTRLGREVAIKVLPHELTNDRDRLARFEREARSASALNHRNIVTIHDFSSHDGETWLVMELIRGESLRAIIADGPLPLKKLLSIATGVADGLAAAHAAGIVHRDLKPENVMITGDGTA